MRCGVAIAVAVAVALCTCVCASAVSSARLLSSRVLLPQRGDSASSSSSSSSSASVSLVAPPAAAVTSAALQPPLTVSLDGDWQFVSSNGSVRGRGSVPGQIHTDLMANGIIGEPYDQYNELAQQWVALDDWTYSRNVTLATSDISGRPRALLHMSGVDTGAIVSVNGHEVGTPSSMFVDWWIDVSGRLVAGNNTITVQLVSAAQLSLQRQAAYPYPVPRIAYKNELGARQFIRKAQSHFGWDWGPAFATAGMFRSVELALFGSAVVTASSARVAPLDSSLSAFFVNVGVWLQGTGTHVVQVTCAGATAHAQIAVNGESSVSVLLVVQKPQLWWPAGYGDQPMYEVDIVVRADSTAGPVMQKLARRVAFRQAALQQRAASDGGTTFEFEVNGVPVYAKGVNFIPMDQFESRVTLDQLEWILRSAVDANMNMVRVWGGGLYQSDDFYDLCDDLGLLVWQEMMFACSLYPSNNDFLASVDAEVRTQVRRLSWHPSVVVYGGNNENEVGLFQWYTPDHDEPLYTMDYVRLYLETVRSAVLDEDTTRPFWHSSPSNGMIAEDPLAARWGNPGDVRWGDVHYYNVVNKCTDRSVAPAARFVSEFGFQSFPSLESLADVTTPDQWLRSSAQMVFRQRSPNGTDHIIAQMALLMRVPDDTRDAFPLFVYASQVTQAICYRASVTYWRFLRSEPAHNMGVLYWQLNDIWQGPSWSSIEYSGRWKLLHHHAREFFAPEMLASYHDVSSDAWSLFVVSDRTVSETRTYNITVRQLIDGSPVRTTTQTVAVGAQAATSVLEVSSLHGWLEPVCGADLSSCVVDSVCASCAPDAAGSRDVFLPADLLGARLADPALAVRATQTSSTTADVVVVASAPALFVWLECSEAGVFEWNGLHLVGAGKMQLTTRFVSRGPLDWARFTSTLSVTSAFDLQ